jgi:hypothetical protein
VACRAAGPRVETIALDERRPLLAEIAYEVVGLSPLVQEVASLDPEAFRSSFLISMAQ